MRPHVARLLLVLAGTAAVACTSSPATPPARPPRARTAEPARPPPSARWIPAHRAFEHDEHGAEVGIVDGVRIRTSRKGTSSAHSIAKPPLREFAAIPAELGGGFLFWSYAAMYRADSFLGELFPVASLRFEVRRVRFSPKLAVVFDVEGQRFGLDLPTGRQVAPEPAGLVDVATLSGRRAVAIFDGGTTHVTEDGGESWSDVSSFVAGPPFEVTTQADALWVVDEGHAYRVDGPGAVVQFDELPPSPRDERVPPGWPGRIPPRDYAVQHGLPLQDGTAVVAAGGVVATVDLERGTIVRLVEGALPPNLDCAAVQALGEILFLCKSGDRNAAFRYSRETGEAELEQAFTGNGWFRSDGVEAVLFEGGCSGLGDRAALACVRTASGWEELDATDALDVWMRDDDVSDDDTERALLGWIPRVDGASALLGGWGGGLLDARTGVIRKLHRRALDLLGENLRDDGRRPVVTAQFRQLPSGAVVGWSGAGSFEITSAGEVELSPYAFPTVAAFGPRAMARDDDGRLFHTTDWGTSWAPLAPPVDGAPAPAPSQCGPVGCVSGGWLRIGWEPAAPSAAPPPVTAPPPPSATEPALPTLRCEAAGKASTRSVPMADESTLQLGFGAQRLAANRGDGAVYFWSPLWNELADPWGQHSRESSLRGFIHGPQPPLDVQSFDLDTTADARTRALVRTYWFTPAFEPAAPVVKKTLTLGKLLDHGLATGGPPPQLDVEADDTAVAIPVVGEHAGKTAGIVTIPATGPLMWLSETRDPTPLPLGESSDFLYPISAVAHGGELTLLARDEDFDILRAYRVAGDVATELFAFAPDLDTTARFSLALDEHGEVALIRASGFAVPTESAPAVVVAPGKRPTALAPWSKLTPASDPACRAPGGYRTLVQAAPPWMGLVPESREEPDQIMLALVRWSKDRVCLEAVERDYELDDAPWDYPMMTRVVARFVPEPGAGLVGITPGRELRRPMRCEVVPADVGRPNPHPRAR